jgi:phospholipid transport system transporter-binding protein
MASLSNGRHRRARVPVPPDAMATMALPAQLTMQDAPQTLAALQRWLETEPQPRLDASALQTLDTAALALLLELQRQATAAGKRLQLTGAPPKLTQLAQLYDVAELIDL